MAITWKEKYNAVVVDCSLRFCGDRIKMSLPKKKKKKKLRFFFFFFLGRLPLRPGAHSIVCVVMSYYVCVGTEWKWVSLKKQKKFYFF